MADYTDLTGTGVIKDENEGKTAISRQSDTKQEDDSPTKGGDFEI